MDKYICISCLEWRYAVRKGMSCSEAGKLGAEVSREIAQAEKQQRIDNYNENPNKCEKCGISLVYEKRHNRFCGRSCSASVNNVISKRKHTIFCLNCGDLIKNVLTGSQKFCNRECQLIYQWRMKEEKVLRTGNFGDMVPHARKNLLLRILPNCCSICGLSEWMGINEEPKPILLIADHIDGNSENNNLDNLRLICSNCDATLPTYKSKNKDSGRSKRRQRYAEGKSY